MQNKLHINLKALHKNEKKKKNAKARSIVKLSVLWRPKHRREAAQKAIIVEVSVRGDIDCTQGVSTWSTSKRAGDFENL